MPGDYPEYDLHGVHLPRLTGGALRAFATLLESPLGGLMVGNLFEGSGINWLRKQPVSAEPLMRPLAYGSGYASESSRAPAEEWPAAVQAGPGFRFDSAHDYARAYREGRTTPLQVAERALAAIRAADQASPALRAFIAVQDEDVLEQARAASERIAAGQALSVLDGVPLAVKDELDMRPYPTTVGTRMLGRRPAERDASTVARLRQSGALLLGKANMHEIGFGVTGHNPHHGTPRNPYGPGHYTGGSSSGPAAAVAAGLCPAALGADGGGSIRIPAAFCGLVGLKPTHGRVSEAGAYPLCWSVAHVGPIAATAGDAALMYAAIAGPDLTDPSSLHQPLPDLAGWDDVDLRGLRLGVYWPWFRHAEAEIVAANEALLNQFARLGAQIVEVRLPGLEAARLAHTVTIASEMFQSLQPEWRANPADFSLDVRVNLALAAHFKAEDYLRAQRVRAELAATFGLALGQVDALITPATGVVAPVIQADALAEGESDLTTLVEIMRFIYPANLTGLPAISFPAGYTRQGLPIGMQAIGRAWNEKLLLRLARAAELTVERREPQVFYRLLA